MRHCQRRGQRAYDQRKALLVAEQQTYDQKGGDHKPNKKKGVSIKMSAQRGQQHNRGRHREENLGNDRLIKQGKRVG